MISGIPLVAEIDLDFRDRQPGFQFVRYEAETICLNGDFLKSLGRAISRKSVYNLYFEPKYDKFWLRTIWSLSNAFNSAFKELEPIPQFSDGEAERVPGGQILAGFLVFSGVPAGPPVCLIFW